MWKRVLGLFTLLLVLACSGIRHVESVTRPNTTELVGVAVEAEAWALAQTVFAHAHPIEAGICLYGSIRDTTFGHNPLRQLYVDVTQVTASLVAEATPNSLTFPLDVPGYIYGCEKAHDLVGVGHSHPGNPAFYCHHSDPDALFLFHRKDLLFSLVYCNGGLELMWQDGRRQRDVP